MPDNLESEFARVEQALDDLQASVADFRNAVLPRLEALERRLDCIGKTLTAVDAEMSRLDERAHGRSRC